MPRRSWIGLLGVWPGLAQIWMGQEILGLLLASSFATSLNLAVCARWIWTDSLSGGGVHFLTAFAATIWVCSLAGTVWWAWLCHPERHRREIERLFREAMEAYLQGRWNEARTRIERVLTIDDSDADALMQLGAIYVRTQQPTAARRAFRQCLAQDGGAKWRWEIAQATAKLDRMHEKRASGSRDDAEKGRDCV